eukprot:RCo014699
MAKSIPTEKLKAHAGHFTCPKWADLPPEGTVLEVVKDGKPLETLLIDDCPYFLLGRGSDADFVLSHETLSRIHLAVVHHRNGSCFVISLSAVANATRVNDKPVQYNFPTKLQDGDILQLAESSRSYVLKRNEPSSSGVKTIRSSFSKAESKAENQAKLQTLRKALADYDKDEKNIDGSGSKSTMDGRKNAVRPSTDSRSHLESSATVNDENQSCVSKKVASNGAANAGQRSSQQSGESQSKDSFTKRSGPSEKLSALYDGLPPASSDAPGSESKSNSESLKRNTPSSSLSRLISCDQSEKRCEHGEVTGKPVEQGKQTDRESSDRHSDKKRRSHSKSRRNSKSESKSSGRSNQGRSNRGEKNSIHPVTDKEGTRENKRIKRSRSRSRSGGRSRSHSRDRGRTRGRNHGEGQEKKKRSRAESDFPESKTKTLERERQRERERITAELERLDLQQQRRKHNTVEEKSSPVFPSNAPRAQKSEKPQQELHCSNRSTTTSEAPHALLSDTSGAGIADTSQLWDRMQTLVWMCSIERLEISNQERAHWLALCMGATLGEEALRRAALMGARDGLLLGAWQLLSCS